MKRLTTKLWLWAFRTLLRLRPKDFSVVVVAGTTHNTNVPPAARLGVIQVPVADFYDISNNTVDCDA